MVKSGLLNVGDVTTLGLVSYFVALVVVGAVGLRIFLPKERRDSRTTEAARPIGRRAQP